MATDVGCCRELCEGVNDGFGQAGFIVPPMHKDLLADAIVEMAQDRKRIHKMGEAGRKRVEKFYTQPISMGKYRALYSEVLKEG